MIDALAQDIKRAKARLSEIEKDADSASRDLTYLMHKYSALKEKERSCDRR